ncbi:MULTISPECIES: branched-chain amino acid transaminase [Streptomycetaceae]|uniref:Branched-chain-amino-acid aminotransferase n=1 Tax=Streptantibioticus cattleyicolor (strain ATCC 35852 / DSM 46488 / JCM 4925 / NBRC 14057 / NRRL 8057) TaxID=1003195 RepID=F8K3D8_STREN|nr:MULTISPECIES: branched-chain amino acid transaminase [Streptomycetaceae]AEW95053.1 branched-chain amino acid aminotransferase [Streptantibioticus cattleyicolor NRRL 8057 = DSM 46488]MYS59650.1 branched-chain amino acid transaminase [Streptomyces sp. SID5468]CCB75403.1 Branched-chain amino acid aminotransferase [Streptantibioticus cattleyicolor NRRL 8057 = DSM 46488]
MTATTGEHAATPTPQRRPGVLGWAYHQGEYLPATEARLPLTTQALQYGTGVFEGIRGYAAADGDQVLLFRAHDHFARLLRSCALLRIDPGATVDELVGVSAELLRRNAVVADTYLRPLAYKLALLPGSPPGVSLSGVSDALSVTAFALGAYTSPRGIRCAVSSWTRPRGSSVPVRAKTTGGYVNNALAMDEARAAGYDDAVLLDERGKVAEATTANVLVVKGDRLLTPPASADILPGITRDTVLTLAADLGLDTAECELGPADLYQADEVLLTGTGVGITPVTEVSGRPVADGVPGPVTTRLTDTYAQIVRGAGDPRYAHWLTAVRIDRGQS